MPDFEAQKEASQKAARDRYYQTYRPKCLDNVQQWREAHGEAWRRRR
jgi:hypothetical protein